MSQQKKRYLSIDVFRGFTMLWLLGMETVVIAFSQAMGVPWLDAFAAQFDHVPWSGLHFEDVIFPSLLFISCATIPVTIKKSGLQDGWQRKALAIGKRCIILVICGIVYNINGAFTDFFHVRYASVLGRIGIVWALTGWLYLYLLLRIPEQAQERVLWGLFAFILAAYATVLGTVPTPDYPDAYRFSPEGNIACWVDRNFLPGTMYNPFNDPEGLLSTFSALGTGLSGVLCSRRLFGEGEAGTQRIKSTAMLGGMLLLAGLFFSFVQPVNKNLWTAPYVLLVAGMDFLALALLRYYIDLRAHSLLFLEIFGRNTIFVYMLQGGGFILQAVNYLFIVFIVLLPKAWGFFLTYLLVVLLETLLQYWLYKKNIDIHI